MADGHRKPLPGVRPGGETSRNGTSIHLEAIFRRSNVRVLEPLDLIGLEAAVDGELLGDESFHLPVRDLLDFFLERFLQLGLIYSLRSITERDRSFPRAHILRIHVLFVRGQGPEPD